MIDATFVPCAEWSEKLAASTIDLSPAAREGLEKHLTTCPACRRCYKADREIDAHIRNLPVAEPPVGLPAQLLEYWRQEKCKAEEIAQSEKPFVELLSQTLPLDQEQFRNNGRSARNGVHSLAGDVFVHVVDEETTSDFEAKVEQENREKTAHKERTAQEKARPKTSAKQAAKLPNVQLWPKFIRPASRRRRIVSVVNSIAAVLVVGAILSGFFLLFTNHHARVDSSVKTGCGLALSAKSQSFSAVSGQGNPDSQYLDVSATSSCKSQDVFTWQAISASGWLSIRPSNGQLRGATDTLMKVNVNAAGLKPGTYSSSISIVSAHNQQSVTNSSISILAPHSTQTVKVQLIVQTPSAMGVTPLSFNFSAIQGTPNPSGQVISIKNNSGSQLNWLGIVNTHWLSIGSRVGSIAAGESGQVTVNINASGLVAGTYTGKAILSGTDANGVNVSGSPQIIPVNLVVRNLLQTPSCTLQQLSSNPILFSGTQGAPNPSPQAEVIKASNCAWPVGWQATPSVSWLNVTPSSGSFSGSGQSATLAFAVSSGGMMPGTYSTKVSITATNGSHRPIQGSPQLVTVTLTVTGYNHSGRFRIIPSPNGGSGLNQLSTVAAVSSTDIWAVGYYINSSPILHYQTLIEQWSGTSWKIVPSPNVGTGNSALGEVAAVSASDVWAVGYDEQGSGTTYQTLTEHWDGTNWSVVPSPNPSRYGNILSGVATISANNVWAVGYDEQGSGTTYQTLTEHWNGTNWSVVSSPNPRGSNQLFEVAAVSANDVWAVGSGSSLNQTLTEHWDGTNWSVVPSLNPSRYGNILYGVAAISASDIWAVGQYYNGSAYQTLIEHWDGTNWSVVPSPNPSRYDNVLYGVAAISASDIWAVGEFTGPRGRPLIEHWDGTNWSVVLSPNPSRYDNALLGVAVVSANDVWAVGSQNGKNNSRTLTEHYS